VRALIVLAACAHASPPPVVAIVSANAEWKALVGNLSDRRVADTPYGEWLVHRFGARDVIFFHGGYGKVAAAGSTQYAIARWHPRLVVNLGTCGGFGGTRAVGDVVLASRTIIYDLVEQMGDPDEPIRDYTTELDTSRWPASLRARVAIEPIVSADRDLVAGEVAALAAKYRASVGDWESGAIAWTARKNGTPVLVLRAVTDVVDAAGHDATYGDPAAWPRVARAAMASLVELFAAALPDL
jgi:adenosylhomocysteine nucleosidase